MYIYYGSSDGLSHKPVQVNIIDQSIISIFLPPAMRVSRSLHLHSDILIAGNQELIYLEIHL